MGKLRPRRDVPFSVLARPSPSAYTLALPRRMRLPCAAALPSTSIASTPSLSVLEPSRARGPSPTPGRDRRASARRSCCSTAAGCAESRATWCAGGATSADNEWRRKEALVRCRDKVAEYDSAVPRRRRAGRRDRRLSPPLPPPAAGGRRPAGAPRDPRPRAGSATRDPRPRATRAARPGPALAFIKGGSGPEICQMSGSPQSLGLDA